MANGTYGTNRAANINPTDAEIWYNYKPKRSVVDENFNKFKQLNSNQVLVPSTCEGGVTSDSILSGMYTLKLPLEQFGQPGIYTIYIKPKEIPCKIETIGALAAFPEVRGIVLSLPEGIEDASGYRVEYFNNNGNRESFFRIVTSCGKVEPISQNLTSSYSNSIGFRYNSAASLSFLTVTPSTSTEFNANDTPFIGKPSQDIVLINTNFNPLALEVEIVEHDAETLSYMLEGNQIRTLDKGLVTTFNFKNEIYKQHEHFTLKDSYTGNPVHEIRKDKEDNIDFTVSADLLD